MHNARRLLPFLVALAVLGFPNMAGAASAALPPIRTHSLSTAPASFSGPPATPSTDPRLTGVAGRLRRLVGAARAGSRGGAGQSPSAQQAAIVQLRRRVGSGVQIRIRPETDTPMQLKAAVLEPAAGGAAGAVDDRTTARSFLRANRVLLGLDDPDAELQLERIERDQLGRRHLRFSQSFGGLPVWPDELIVHVDAAGNVDLMDGAFVRSPNEVDRTPQIAPDEAIERARRAVPDGASRPTSTPALVIYAPLDHAPRLAWKLEVFVSIISRWLVVVDATDGAILSQFNQVMDARVSGSGIDVFGNPQPLNVWAEGNSFFLVDTSKFMFDPTSDPPDPDRTRGGIIILDARNQPPTSMPDRIPDLFQFTSSTPDAGWLADGVSAARGLSETYDYYLERHNRNSIDGQGGNMIGVVRFGQNLFNAFFTNGLMLFGDAVPFAGGLDVAAHEMTHGVTEKSANLVYQDQSGALNEAISDIFGENVEARTFGEADWLKGAQILSTPIQNYRDCGAVQYLPGVPYPSTMSEFVRTSEDNGGVHGNSCIINHAYYLLAQGLEDAIGIGDAERIFYRALTVHLVRNSQFIDARLACVQSAEELFGPGSRQAQRTADAFDAVEIFDGAPTPEPTPFPSVSGPDATVFVFEDLFAQVLALGRREEALGDPAEGVGLSCGPVAATRPAVSGDGSLVMFVNDRNDACLIPTDADETTCEACLGVDGSVSSVAMSPDESRFAFVLLDANGQPDNMITVIDLGSDTAQEFPLRAPLLDGQPIGSVQFAQIMDFTADGQFLIYDAFSVIPVADGTSVGLWSVFALDLANDRTLTLVEPTVGLNVGNPALSQTSDNFLTLDVGSDQAVSVVTLNLNTGETAELAAIRGDLGVGVPGYTGDDAAVVYTQGDAATPLGVSLMRQPLAADRLTPTGPPTVWLADAALGVIYRRGEFTGPTTCTGDCNGDRAVTINEILIGVNIALGDAPLDECSVFDANGDGTVTVDEIVAAVSNALGQCPGAS